MLSCYVFKLWVGYMVRISSIKMINYNQTPQEITIEVCDYNPPRIIQECVLGETFWQRQELFRNFEEHRDICCEHVWKGWRVAHGYPAASMRTCRWSFTIWKENMLLGIMWQTSEQGRKLRTCSSCKTYSVSLVQIHIYICIIITMMIIIIIINNNNIYTLHTYHTWHYITLHLH